MHNGIEKCLKGLHVFRLPILVEELIVVHRAVMGSIRVMIDLEGRRWFDMIC